VCKRQFGRGPARGQHRAIAAQATNNVIGLVLHDIQIVLNDLADHTAESFDVLFFPLPELPGLFIGEIFLFVFGGIVNAMPQIIVQKRRKFSTPQLAAIRREFNRAA
jgi:hypothetical protein